MNERDGTRFNFLVCYLTQSLTVKIHSPHLSLNHSVQQERKKNSPVLVKNLASSSVFVDPKYPYSVKLRQFGEEDAEEGAGVDEEMCRVVFGVETGENVPVGREQGGSSVESNYGTRYTGSFSGTLSGTLSIYGHQILIYKQLTLSTKTCCNFFFNICNILIIDVL